MDTVVDNLLRRSGPGRRSITGSRDTQSAYSSNPHLCMAQCKANFIQSLRLREGAGFDEACASLTEDQPQEWFWSLYCCDSANCGVYIEREPQSLGQSRPPQITCGNSTPFLVPLDIGPFTSATISTSASVLAVSTTTPTTLRPETATATITTITSATTQAPFNAKASKPDRLSSGAKAAIGVCAALSTVALAIALLFMRRRRRNIRGYHRTSPAPAQHTRTDSGPPHVSPMPLMTPPASSSSKTTPSTPPPLRLSDRRYLPPPPPRPTTMSTTTPPSPPPGESTASEGSVINASPHMPVSFPRALSCAPTASRLISPHERRATTTKSSIRLGAPINNGSHIPETAALHRSTSSRGSSIGRTAPFLPLAPGHQRAAPAPASSEQATAARDPRPRDARRPTADMGSTAASCFFLFIFYQLSGVADTATAASPTSPRLVSIGYTPGTGRPVVNSLPYSIRLAPFLYALPQFADAITPTTRYACSIYTTPATPLSIAEACGNRQYSVS
ncbi:uncharacterized protein PG986_009573 [Apiospora aurea]|uniref:Transmembrane protein n=1 Tax=Apiospora aurea TaxID=335848 RepID=A0ABR1Q8Q3_9PEZI